MNIGKLFFKYRSFTPVPLLIAALILAKPSLTTFLVGLAVALVGEAIRLWGVLYAGSATRTTGRVGADRLVTDGPYAYVRNPLYVGNFLLSLGILLMAWPWMPWMLLVLVGLFALQYGSIVREEEHFLRAKFGAEYDEYCRHVRRWLPSLRGFSNTEPSHPVLRKALRSERNSLRALLIVTLLILGRWVLL
ncbi:MAG: isoprenylcysteine carboxylmethyltransferase family protein [candidate division KSB1 bacterium]|nr:isoprenylcysteine carboxylmethyltransferase family protein [candidate division KSB1 bacterium]